MFYKSESKPSIKPSISENGRYIAFESYDTNGIQVKDTQTGSLKEVSSSSMGETGNGESYAAAISDDGRYVAFISEASNLVLYDVNETADIFLKDTVTSTIQLLSSDQAKIFDKKSSYPSAPSISSDGRYVAFAAGDYSTIFIKDTHSGALTEVGIGFSPDLSADGRFITFSTTPYFAYKPYSSLNDSEHEQIFKKNLLTGDVTRLTSENSLKESPYYSSEYPFEFGMPSISADGRFVVFQTTSREKSDSSFSSAQLIILCDTSNGELTTIGKGDQASISADGNFVTFHRWDDSWNLPEVNGVYIYDVQSLESKLVSCSNKCDPPKSYSEHPTISGNGRYVAFDSIDKSLLPDVIPGIIRGDYNNVGGIFVKDTWSGEVVRASRS